MYILRKDDPSSQAVLLSESPVTLGSLVSNRLIVADPEVDAIHCMIEQSASGALRLTDLNSRIGVFLNGHRIEVEADLNDGDLLAIGGAFYRITSANPAAAKSDFKKNVLKKNSNVVPIGRRRPFFNPVTTVPRNLSDRRLEVVAYWGNTVLNVDHFHRDIKGFSDVVIGDEVKSHFISGDRSPWASWVLAKAVEDSYLIKLQDGMRAQVRARGITSKLTNKNEILLTESDYAHIKHGVVDYFIRFVTPPNVRLPEKKLENKFLTFTGIIGAVAYIAMVTLAMSFKPVPLADPALPPWQEIHIEPISKIKSVADIRKDLQKPRPVKVEPPKSVQPEVIEKPKLAVQPTPEKVIVPIVEKSLAVAATTAKVSNSVGKSEVVSNEKIAAVKTAVPNFKLSPAVPAQSGGPGQTMKTLAGGPLKGFQQRSKPGVEGQTGKQASMVDLKNLSGNLGPVLANNAPGGLKVDFRPTGGGGGMKQGTSARNYNLGEHGTNGALAIPGSGSRIGDWGKNPSGLSGGITGALSVPGKNHSSVAVVVKPQDPLTGLVSLTQEEIFAVIRQNLNQIRHCYEQTLQRAPNAQGRVKVRFSIGAGGRVILPAIADNTINDVKLDGCILGKVARWQFPVPRAGDVNVSYPFDFFPQL